MNGGDRKSNRENPPNEDFCMTVLADQQSDKLILALDVGTLSVRASAYDFAGNAVAFADQPIALTQLSSSQIEQDPVEINTAVSQVMQQLLADPVVSSAVSPAPGWPASAPALWPGTGTQANR
ncbi:MAG: FGGY family carbohydrate kinase [Chloroflexota bacterium]